MVNDPKTISGFLRNVPVFKELDDNNLDELSHNSIWKDYSKGETIAYAGETWPYVMVIAKGEIRGIKISPEGRALNTLTISKGEGFWNPTE